MLITPFDPWNSDLCTCPEKLTLNPYTGCSHQCLYCYASSYVPDFFRCRPKKNVVSRLQKEAARLSGELVSLANSSDPYPPMEKTLGLTRTCLETLSKHKCKIQVVTKSALVARDIDVLQKSTSMVSMSIATDDDATAKSLEPYAPRPRERMQALEKLVSNGLAVSVRIDPIIPFLNDDVAGLIKRIAAMGVPHVTCSTYKAKQDNWKRLAQAFPNLARGLRPLYFEKGERRGRSFYLRKTMRQKILERVKELVDDEGMTFASCREGIPQLNSATCDGSWLLA